MSHAKWLALVVSVGLSLATPWLEAAEPKRHIAVRLLPLGPAVAGKPLRLLVGIKNLAPSRLLFAGPETPGLTVHWFEYSFSSEEPDQKTGGGGGVLKGSLDNPANLLCPRADDVLGLAPGAELMRVAELALPADLPPGKLSVKIDVSLAEVRDDLGCVTPSLVTARGRTLMVVRRRAPGRRPVGSYRRAPSKRGPPPPI